MTLQESRCSRIDAQAFAESLIIESRRLGLNLNDMMIDHLCYRTASESSYLATCKTILNDSPLRGELLSEAQINGRPISTFRLSKPIFVEGFNIECLEVPSPKQATPYRDMFEHFEVVTTQPLDQLKTAHTKLLFEGEYNWGELNSELSLKTNKGKIKFHHLPLSSVICLENSIDFSDVILRSNFLKALKAWTPLVSGSLPLEIETEQSDLDILLCHSDLSLAASEISNALNEFGKITWKRSVSRQGECLIGELKLKQRPIELFVSRVPVLQQDSHTHFLREYQLLVKHGQTLRDFVRIQKKKGNSTEQAFCNAFGVSSDPYLSLLQSDIEAWGLRL
jgi:predicted metalloenzyme YecM